MRFDDSLDTVLSAEMSTPFGAQSAWRQLVDLIGRRRIDADPAILARLKAIRADVPPPVRAASARSLAFTDPPHALVRLFADDELSIAAPVLRIARLRDVEWIEMLPGLSPAARSILRHRRDLGGDVRRALDSFGTVDFVLPSQDPVVSEPEEIIAEPTVDVAIAVPEANDAVAEVAAAEPVPMAIDWTELVVSDEPVADSISILPPEAAPPTQNIDWAEVAQVTPDSVDAEAPIALVPEVVETPAPAELHAEPAVSDTPFVSLSSVALGLPVVAEALRLAATEPTPPESLLPEPQPLPPLTVVETVPPVALVTPETVVALPVPVPVMPATADPATGPFQISDLVARIDAYQRRRDETSAETWQQEIQPALFELETPQAETFRFETDAAGVVRWIEGAARAPLIGLSLDLAALPSGSRVDGVAAGAFRRRAGFSNARLIVDGVSDAAGQWRITGIPVFDHANGRFTGYRGSARRPRADESAEPVRSRINPAADALRQLVHELRTPTNAIAGFAEMIEGELLGPVPLAYRDHAGTIRSQASDLLTAIDDIDLAARLETQALDLRPGDVPVAPLLARIADDLAPLANLRGTTLAIGNVSEGTAISGDDRAVERLIARLTATLVSAGSVGETINVAVHSVAENMLALAFDRPRALAAYAGDALLAIDAEREAETEGAPLLGTGFALRLARNLAVELGGTLVIGEDRLTLRLPAAVSSEVEQVSSS